MRFIYTIPHNITIEAASNGGFLVTVGCAKLAYGGSKKEKNRLIDELYIYLRDPSKTITAYGQMEQVSQEAERLPGSTGRAMLTRSERERPEDCEQTPMTEGSG